MVKELKDDGVLRGEHQVIFSYLPGQITTHTPRWNEYCPPLSGLTFSTRVVKIFQVEKAKNERYIKRESEGRIYEEIRKHTKHKPPSICYYALPSGENETTCIELDIFPDSWELDFEQGWRLLFSSKQIPSEVSSQNARKIKQNYLLFCNTNSDKQPFISSIQIPATGRYFISSDMDLGRKQIRNGEKGTPREIKKVYSDKPRFPGDRSNYVPWPIYEVYIGTIQNNSPKILYNILDANGLISDKEKSEECMSSLFDLFRPNTETRIEDVRHFLNFPRYQNIFQRNLDDVAKLILQYVNGNSSHQESAKLGSLKSSNQVKSDINDIFDFYYSEDLEVGQFVLGYFSGRCPAQEDRPESRPILRKFEGKFDSNSSSFEFCAGMDGAEWPVFYKLFPTEGILICPKEKFYEIVKEDNKRFEALHAIAHAMIKSTPRHSGIDYGQLGEFFFGDPQKGGVSKNLAFLIYSIEPGRFRSKGLRFLFENRIDNLVADTRDVLDCPFSLISDETQEHHKKGCGACSMIAVGCGYFNSRIDTVEGLKALGTI